MILWKRQFHNICIDKMKALFPIKKEYVKKKEEAYMEDKLKHILARSSACI